jgi:type IV secretion system protein VirB10
MTSRIAAALVTAALAASAQTPAAAPQLRTDRPAESVESTQPEFVVESGTKIPLSLINSVSTKNSVPGDRIYLESVFPILVNGRIVIPPGSYVAGTVTQVKRPGRVKGRGELFVRFDSLTLPNGTTRDFRGRVDALDGRASEELEREEGRIRSEGNKSGDVRTVGEAAAGGASIGAIAGAAGDSAGMGAGIGGAAGAAAGLVGVLLTRGPEAVLAKGTTLEMVLDRPLRYNEQELASPEMGGSRRRYSDESVNGPLPSVKDSRQSVPIPGSRLPL